MGERNIIKLRGLPWNSTAQDIMEFLKDCQPLEGEKSIHLAISHRDGRPNGEAFVELASPDDVEKSFEYNKNVLGHRYIEIFNAKPEEFEMCLKRQNLVQQDTFIKLRGLPFSCKLEDIEQFFEGLEIRNGTNGIYIVFDNRGRPTGEAFVQFSSSEDTDLAMKKNREKIGQRYIEIFRSSSSECRRATIFATSGRGGGMMGGNMGGGMGGGFGNDRGMGRGPRNNRSNFRDRPYPDTPWNGNNNGNNDGPWRGGNRGNFGGGGGGNNFNDNFGGGNNNNNFNDNFSSGKSDFERQWNAGGNSFNSFGGGGGGGSNNSSGPNNNKNNNNFDRDNFGGNNFNNFGGNNNNFDRFGGPNNGGPGGVMDGLSNYGVHMRGMPYDCAEDDVMDFFAPLKLVGVNIIYNNNGRHSGEADAYFATMTDAQEAMKKHKEKMGARYIELFAKGNDRRGGGRF